MRASSTTMESEAIQGLMESSGVRFGTSGVRGPVVDMTDRICFIYTLGFLEYLEKIGELKTGDRVMISGDLRSSTDRIMRACFKAVQSKGLEAIHCGRLPSPAIALYGIEEGAATIMVTGSHIPDDFNGIKFNRSCGEILKRDEEAIRECVVHFPRGMFDDRQGLTNRPELPKIVTEARDIFVRRYLDFFPVDALKGLRVGVYQHSAVGRDLMVEILEGLGAETVTLGRSETFVPVDTEAIRPEDVENASRWSREFDLDAIVSTDGDSDRPLISDENGRWIRGDVAGILVASFFEAQAVVAPISCNSALELSGLFGVVERCKIGSPFVIEAMQRLHSTGVLSIVGYEANGGFLQETDVERGDSVLKALPTRDAIIVHLAILASANEASCPISSLLSRFPRRYTHSDRLKAFPQGKGRAKIALLWDSAQPGDFSAIESEVGDLMGPVHEVDSTDGLRVTFSNGEIVHFRPSGNAPEMRCYSEADTESRAAEIVKLCLERMEDWR